MQKKPAYLQVLAVLLCAIIGATAFGQSSPDQLKSLISKNSNVLGITKEEAGESIINSSYTDDASGIEHVYVQQTYKNIKVFNVILSMAFKNGVLLYSSGKFLNSATSFNMPATPVVEAGNALFNAARHLNLRPANSIVLKRNNFSIDKKMMFAGDGIAKRDIETELLWAQDDSGNVHLTWNVSIDVANSTDWWNVRVDAVTGEIVNKDNLTVHEKKARYEDDANIGTLQAGQVAREPASNAPGNILQSAAYNNKTIAPSYFSPPNVTNATYRVVPFPYDSRNFGPVTTDNNPWLKAGAGNNATTYGWHFDSTTNYTITRGNNVYAYDDSASINGPGRVATSSTAAPSLTFDVTPNFAIQPYDSTNRNFAIVNLFYWNNIIHDIFYQYGFTEGAGNFQASNIGRGGTGNDYVKSEAQDGSGSDNANFSTPADGTSGRMQMYLWSGIPDVTVTAPASIAGKYTAAESGLSTGNKLYKIGPVAGQVVTYDDVSSGGTVHEACDSSVAPLHPVAGKIAYITRGTCPFTTKMRAAQKYGAIGVLLANSIAGAAPITAGGTDNAVTIPAVMVSQSDGAKIAGEIPNGVSIKLVAGILADGDIDNGIVTHEYGHGISNRLTGGRTNASCLSNAEQGGEGWSDYMALMVTTNWQNSLITDGPKPRPMATYAENQPADGPGLRRVPYTTDLTIDTLTYRSMDGNTTGNGEVHNIGEIWCSALWDMTWNIIQHEGSITGDIYNSSGPGGNIIALKLVVEGMKLQPCRPGFLDARNAILAADSILFNFKHKCDIWNAFARRGMGYSARQGLSTSTGDQTPAFDVPAGVMLTRSASPTVITAGSNVTYNTALTCQCQLPSTSYTLTDTIPAGFTYVNSSAGVLTGNTIVYSAVNFSNPLQTVSLSATLKATDNGCPVTKPINDDRESNQLGGLVSGSISGAIAWAVSTTHANSGTSAWYAANSSSANNFALTSGAFTVGSLSILSFWHYYVTENYIDGGKVEISTDNGITWTDARPYFLQNGYNGLLNSSSPQANTYAFTGTSYATSTSNAGQFIQSVIDLSSFTTKSIKIRFRFQTSASNAGNQTYDGWYIDDITLSNGCGGVVNTALQTSAVKADSIARPFFTLLSSSALPLVLIDFSASPVGKQVLLHWETSAEYNTSNFEIERSTDGISWTATGTVTAAGLSSNSYTYYDQNPPGQVNYYRIKMNDNDGKYTYTPVKKVDMGSSAGLITISPNPAVNATTIYFGLNAKDAVLMVTDLQGRVMQHYTISNNASSLLIPTSQLPSGSYFIRMQLKTGLITKKMIVVH